MKTNDFLGSSPEGFHRVCYTEWGNPTPYHSAVICVHGLLRNSHDVDALSRFLSLSGQHVFCPDIAGRGDSDWFKNHKHYNVEQYIADMTVLIARTAATQINWIGTSLGGLIGMMMAALPNTPIQRLVLNDIGPQIPIIGLRRLAKYTNANHTFLSKEEALLYYKNTYKDFGPLSESHWSEFTEHSIKSHATAGTFVPKHDPDITRHKIHLNTLWELMHHPL